MSNMELWDKLSHPPKSALKTIQGGRLKGFTDVNPQYRYKAMTEVFGQCGVGWKFEIKNIWPVDGPGDEVFAFAEIGLYTRIGGEWSDPIPGVGGSMLIAKEKAGMHPNDEGYKMAITDALGTAMKMIGVASSIYEGSYDGSKYTDRPVATASKTATPKKETEKPTTNNFKYLKKMTEMKAALGEEKYRKILKAHGAEKSNEITNYDAQKKVWNDMTAEVELMVQNDQTAMDFDVGNQ